MRAYLAATLLSLVLLTSATAVVVAENESSDHTVFGRPVDQVSTTSADRDDATFSARVNQNSRHFELKGVITSLSGNSFTASGQTVFVDPTKVKQIVLNGVLKVGEKVHAVGLIVGGQFYAREVNVIELDKDDATGSATPSAQFHAIIRLTSSTGSSTPSATPSANLIIKIHGALDRVTVALQNLLNLLQSFLHSI